MVDIKGTFTLNHISVTVPVRTGSCCLFDDVIPSIQNLKNQNKINFKIDIFRSTFCNSSIICNSAMGGVYYAYMIKYSGLYELVT